MKKISLITICRNSAKTIAATIDSIVSQRYPDLQYIIVDGASTDDTINIVKSYGSAIDVLISEPDRGISDAFNKGIKAASGEVVGFINSDDRLLPNALEKINSYFLENVDGEVLHGDILLYDGALFVKRVKPAARWWYPWRMVLFNHPSTFVRKGVYQQHGLFSLDYRFAMDVDLFLRWIKSGVRIHYMPEPFVRMQAGGLSGKFAFESFAEKKRALLSNGFPRLLTSLHCHSLRALQVVAMIQTMLRKSRMKKQDLP